MRPRYTFSASVLFMASGLGLALWAPWLPMGASPRFLEDFRRNGTYLTVMRDGIGDIYCQGLKLSWSPFGRQVAYCDNAVWRVDIKGGITLQRFTKYLPNAERDTAMRTFSYYKDNTAHQMCRAWNANDPVAVTAEYLGMDSPLPDGTAKVKFQRDGLEFFLMMPQDKVEESHMVPGLKYSVDMNNLCVYEHHFQKTQPLDPAWLNYVMPVPVNE